MIQRVAGQVVGIFAVGGIALLAACSTDATDPCGGAASLPGSLPTTGTVSLSPGEFQIFQDAAASGAVTFPAAGAAGAAYLVVGQLASSVSGDCSTFALGGQQFPPDLRAGVVRGAPSLRFHDMLRAREAVFARRAVLTGAPRTAPATRTPPPTVGTKRTFKICADLDCNTLASVAATAQAVGGNAAIFIDDTAPTNVFIPGDLDELIDAFDQVAYPIATARFGPPSDIDGNGVVMVLLTQRINRLVPKPECENAFVTGFFYGADIAPGLAPAHNNGEVFYGLLPDPAGSATQCPYSRAFVKRILPITFIHEFQHMISFNQHVLVRGGVDETLWLNEAMSHLAEELGGLHYDSLGIDSTASRYHLGNLYNAYVWMRSPSDHALVTETPPGTLEQRGAGWLFARWLADQYGPGITRTLLETSSTGAANVAAATGASFRALVGRWALGLYVNGLPAFSASPLAYSSWDFRATYASLHAQRPAEFPVNDPLRPDSGVAAALSVTGTLRAGSSAFAVSTQPAFASGFNLVFRGPGGAALETTTGPQLAVARLR